VGLLGVREFESAGLGELGLQVGDRFGEVVGQVDADEQSHMQGFERANIERVASVDDGVERGRCRSGTFTFGVWNEPNGESCRPTGIGPYGSARSGGWLFSSMALVRSFDCALRRCSSAVVRLMSSSSASSLAADPPRPLEVSLLESARDDLELPVGEHRFRLVELRKLAPSVTVPIRLKSSIMARRSSRRKNRTV